MKCGNVALGIQNAYALHFGRVGGQHRRDKAGGEGVGNGFGRNSGPAQARQRDFDAAFLRKVGHGFLLADGVTPDAPS